MEGFEPLSAINSRPISKNGSNAGGQGEFDPGQTQGAPLGMISKPDKLQKTGISLHKRMIKSDVDLFEDSLLFEGEEDEKEFDVDDSALFLQDVTELLRQLDDGEERGINLSKLEHSVSTLINRQNSPDYLNRLLEVNQNIDAWLDEHQGTYFIHYKKERKETIKRLRSAVEHLIEKAISTRIEGGLYTIPEITFALHTPAREKLARSRVKELAKNYRLWKKVWAEDLLRSPEEMVAARLSVMNVYEEDILILANRKLDVKDDKELIKIIDEFKSLKNREKIIGWQKEHSQAGESLLDQAKKRALEVDDHFSPLNGLDKKVDEGLLPVQRDRIHEIDRWLVRNANRGSGWRKQSEGDIAAKTLSLTERERLYVYYLIATDARKNPSEADFERSQNAEYLSEITLGEFKNKMLATRWKFISHMTNVYMYWHKLTHALQILGKAQEDLKNSIEKEQADEHDPEYSEQALRGLEDEVDSEADYGEGELERLEEAAEDRISAIGEYQERLSLLQENPELGQDPAFRSEVTTIYSRMVKADRYITSVRASDNSVALQTYGKSLGTMMAGRVFANMDKAIAVMNKAIPLGIENWDWVLPETIFAYGSGSSAVIGAAIGLFGAIVTLHNNLGIMNKVETAETFMGAIAGLSRLAHSGWKGVDSIMKASETAENFINNVTSSDLLFKLTALNIAGVAVSSIELAVGATTGISAIHRNRRVRQAESFFKNKYQHIPATTKRENAEEQKEAREARYSDNMTKLSRYLTIEKRDKALFALTGGVMTLTGILLPGIGTIAVAGMTGAGIALTIGGSINAGFKRSKSMAAMFDDFYNVDFIMEQVLEKKRESGDPLWTYYFEGSKEEKRKKEYLARLRDNVRKQLAAAMGFHSVDGASEHIARIYAEFIYNKLNDADLKKNNREEWEAYQNTLKSFGLSFKIKNGEPRPTIAQIAVKMRG